MRIFLGIVVGIVAALAVQVSVDLFANMLYPVTISDMWDRAQVTEAMASRPVPALLITVLGFLLGALIGGYIARRVSAAGWTAWVPVGLLVAIGLIMAFAYPLPTWAWVAMLVAPLAGGMIAGRLGSGMAVREEDSGDADL